MSDPRGVLALDLATVTGWAWGVDHEAPRYGLWRLGDDPNLGRRCSCLANFIEDFCALQKPEMIVFEAPVAKMQTSARSLIYLAGVVEMMGYEQGIPVREEPPQVSRKLILGRGSFFAKDAGGKTLRRANGKMISETKNTVMAWAQSRGWTPETHDVADALCLLEYAHTMRRSRVMTGRAA